ncbi:MBL fold metallo-hydrolase [Thermoleophilia bacterium SCSIO 60948]|nr:MBL fold metallo-hydrolase [Thermoleophilia bacterium SCSIO 60948]
MTAPRAVQLPATAGIEEPADGVVRITIPLALRSPDHISCYVLRLAGGDLLVDTGMLGSESALDAGLAQAGVTPERVLVTHGHIDHWGLATRFADTVLAHPGCRSSFAFAADVGEGVGASGGEGLPDRAAMERVFARYRSMVTGVPARADLADGDLIDGWRVLWTPGHAPGHVCLLREADGVLLAGDHLLPGFTPNVQPSPERADALADFLSSLDRVRDLDVSLVLPSHGEPYRDAAGRAAELRIHHEQRLHQLEAVLAAGPRPLGTLTEEIFGDLVTGEDRMLADMETYAHLEYLRVRDRVRRDESGTWARAA